MTDLTVQLTFVKLTGLAEMETGVREKASKMLQLEMSSTNKHALKRRRPTQP